MNTALNTETTPTIISLADSNNYLVGAIDSNNNFIGLNNAKKVQVLVSFAEAKQFLRDNHIFTAALEYQSAYDEMCGTDTSERFREMIKF